MKNLQIKILLTKQARWNKIFRCFIFTFFCIFSNTACKQKVDSVQIKLLLLNSENYFDQTIAIQGKIKEIGPLDLWFIVEDDSGYIQVTTQNISDKISCLKKGQMILAFGQLERYSMHKYFSLQENLRCLKK